MMEPQGLKQCCGLVTLGIHSLLIRVRRPPVTHLLERSPLSSPTLSVVQSTATARFWHLN